MEVNRISPPITRYTTPQLNHEASACDRCSTPQTDGASRKSADETLHVPSIACISGYTLNHGVFPMVRLPIVSLASHIIATTPS